MKIAYILPSLTNRGPVIFTKYLIDGLLGKVNKIDVFYFKTVTDEIEMGVNTYKISFFSQINFKDYDIIHTTMLVPDLYLLYHRLNIGKVVISSMHNFFKEDLKLSYNPLIFIVYKELWRLALSFANNKLIVSSDEMKEYYLKNLIRKKDIEIIPYGISFKEYESISSHEDEQLLEILKSKFRIIGSVGLAIKRKGFHQLIEFLKINEDFACVIIGDGIEKANLEILAKENNLENRFKILGFRKNSFNYYKYFDIYALVSSSEGFGLAMLEAMSHGIPIVCTRLPIYNKYFKEEDVSFFEYNDIQSLNSAIVRVSINVSHFQRHSRALFENKFSIDVMSNSHLQYYQKILSGN